MLALRRLRRRPSLLLSAMLVALCPVGEHISRAKPSDSSLRRRVQWVLQSGGHRTGCTVRLRLPSIGEHAVNDRLVLETVAPRLAAVPCLPRLLAARHFPDPLCWPETVNPRARALPCGPWVVVSCTLRQLGTHRASLSHMPELICIPSPSHCTLRMYH